ncbi:hypothetical protein NMG60_11030880 [Bertholletia excelsa]
MEVSSFLSPTLPIFFSMYVTIYLLGYFIIFRRWVGVSRNEASSCLISLAHGTPATIAAACALARSRRLPQSFASPNTAVEDAVLEYSTAYFLVDLLHYLVFVPGDSLFIVHHLATLYVLATCRYLIGHGAVAILVLLALAESTSACQNAWSLAGFRRAASPAAAAVHRFLSPLFYSFYTVARGVLGPLFLWKMGIFYASGGAQGLVPNWAWGSWMVVIICSVLVSLLWIVNRWMDLWSEKRRKHIKKLS